MNIVTRFNNWLDNKKEPLRFLIVLTMMCIWICPLQLGLLLEIPFLIIFGFIGMIIMFVIAFSRINRILK